MSIEARLTLLVLVVQSGKSVGTCSHARPAFAICRYFVFVTPFCSDFVCKGIANWILKCAVSSCFLIKGLHGCLIGRVVVNGAITRLSDC